MLSLDKISLFLFVGRNEYFATVQWVSHGYPKIVFAETTFSIVFFPNDFPNLFRIEIVGNDLIKCPFQKGGFNVMWGNEFLFAICYLVDVSQWSSPHIAPLFFRAAHSVNNVQCTPVVLNVG